MPLPLTLTTFRGTVQRLDVMLPDTYEAGVVFLLILVLVLKDLALGPGPSARRLNQTLNVALVPLILVAAFVLASKVLSKLAP
jgi:hypothetical protein